MSSFFLWGQILLWHALWLQGSHRLHSVETAQRYHLKASLDVMGTTWRSWLHWVLTGYSAWAQAPGHPICPDADTSGVEVARTGPFRISRGQMDLVGNWLPPTAGQSPEAIWMPAAKSFESENCAGNPPSTLAQEELLGKVCFLKAYRFLTSARLTLRNARA